MDKLRLNIFTINSKGKTDDKMFICDNMVDVSRILITFVPKRGYEFAGCEINPI